MSKERRDSTQNGSADSIGRVRSKWIESMAKKYEPNETQPSARTTGSEQDAQKYVAFAQLPLVARVKNNTSASPPYDTLYDCILSPLRTEAESEVTVAVKDKENIVDFLC